MWRPLEAHGHLSCHHSRGTTMGWHSSCTAVMLGGYKAVWGIAIAQGTRGGCREAGLGQGGGYNPLYESPAGRISASWLSAQCWSQRTWVQIPALPITVWPWASPLTSLGLGFSWGDICQQGLEYCKHHKTLCLCPLSSVQSCHGLHVVKNTELEARLII